MISYLNDADPLRPNVFEGDLVPLSHLSPAEKHSVLSAIDALPKLKDGYILRAAYHKGQIVIETTQFVGLYQLGPLRLQVLPKVYRSNIISSQSLSQSSQQLLIMLSYAYDFPLFFGETAFLGDGDGWFEFLTTLFVDDLIREWQRGSIKNYAPIYEDLTTIRGRLRVPEHIRYVGKQHLLPVEYDDLSSNNAINRLFRFVSEQLLLISENKNNIYKLRILLSWMDEEGIEVPNAPSLSEIEHISVSRLHSRYDLSLALAKMFAKSTGVSIRDGDNSGRSLFFDLNMLFESYITNILRRHRKEILHSELISSQLIVQGEGHKKALLKFVNENERTPYMKPDVMYLKNKETLLILDIKYKVFKSNEYRGGIQAEDLYQMFAYIKTYACNRVLLIYPATGNTINKTYRFIYSEDKNEAIIMACAIRCFQDVKNTIEDLNSAIRGVYESN